MRKETDPSLVNGLWDPIKKIWTDNDPNQMDKLF